VRPTDTPDAGEQRPLAEVLLGTEGPPPAVVVTMELQRGVAGDLAAFPALATAVAERGIEANCARLLGAARSAGLAVVHCTASFAPDVDGAGATTPLFRALLRPGYLAEGTPATELLAALGPEPGDRLSTRSHGVSPFGGTDLDATLRALGATVLVVAGVSINLGVLGLCIEATNLGYEVIVASDAVVGVPLAYGDEVLARSVSLVATLAPVEQLTQALSLSGNNWRLP
jgi:nicotinamidase-related amidase